MTKIKFFKNNKNFVGIECSGHTDYAEFNKDVLCASLSGVIQSGILGLTEVLKIKGNLVRRDKKGYIKFELPADLEENKLKDSQILFKTMYKTILSLLKQYSQYISMEVIDDVY